jgi:hypothetical protein
VERSAGTYARERYRRSLGNYRRRMRSYYYGLLAAALAVLVAVFALHGLEYWSFIAGTVVGLLLSLAFWVHDEPPEFIEKWRRGADGEKKTENAIKPLLREGWKARHDIDLGRGNADHVLLSPKGVAYLLETKNLAGQLSVERGALTCRFVDDPQEVRRYDLGESLSALSSQVRTEWAGRTGRAAPELRTVVVIWGAFPAKIVHAPAFVYVAGGELARYLAADAESGGS